MKKSFFYLSFALLILVLGCQPNATTREDLLALVPSKTAAVLKTNDFSALSKKLKTNSFVQQNRALPLLKFFETSYEPLSHLQLTGNSLLCFALVGRDELATTLITENSPELLDSVGYDNVKDYRYNGQPIKMYSYKDKTIYGARLKSLFVYGDSKLVVENMVRLSHDNLHPNEQLQKVYKVSSNNATSLFINPVELAKIYKQILPKSSAEFLRNLSGWTSLDLDIESKNVTGSGISMPERDETLGLFKQTKPQKNKMAAVVPLGAVGFYSFTYDDFEVLKDNLSFYRKEDYPKLELDLLDKAAEVGEVYGRDETVLVMRSTRPSETKNSLTGQGKLIDTHRGHRIYSFSKPTYFYRALQPLIKLKSLAYYTVIDDFFVFAKKRSSLEDIIANVQNKTVLAKDKSYKDNTEDQLSEESSLLLVGISKNLVKEVSESVSSGYNEAYKKTTVLGYDYAALQFITNKNFTYINGVFSESAEDNATGNRGGIQIESIKPGEELASSPRFFIKWRTKTYDIAVQGKSNTLYLYNGHGKLRWEKKLDGPILGDIQPIDIYHNHRIQMAFVTPHTFYIIDKNGHVVKPFNKSFKQPITQPLSIFDYNNTGKFRFLITQNDRVTMLDKHLKKVKGFEFHQAGSKILQAPRHFRIGRKDYIVIPEKSGKLHILNPRGQTRVKVKQKIDFSKNPWFLYHDHFTSTDAKGRLIQIDQSGKMSKRDLKLGEDNKIYATAKTLVTFSENKLTIKGKTTRLDYGLYTAPKIFYIKDKLYITITDTQAHKVYLFDSASNLLPGFPVYGNSTIDLKNMDNRGSLELLVQGEGDSVLVYEVQ